MLEIKDLRAGVEGREILQGINLTIKAGEVHAIMGPNGSGKSTLAGVLTGRDDYEVLGGEVNFDGKELLELDPEERAREGVFLAFQHPIEIPGVNTQVFLKAAVNAVRTHRGEPELNAAEFLRIVRSKAKLVGMDASLLNRAVNEGFSGGEKKRAEIFQLAMLEPKFAVLDETDSGLDIDALRIVSDGVNALRSSENAFLIITHFQRILNYIQPDYVHVLYQGRIVKSGGKELALELEEKGYDWIIETLPTNEPSPVDAQTEAAKAAIEEADAIAKSGAGFFAGGVTEVPQNDVPATGEQQAASERIHAERLDEPQPVSSL